MKGSKRHNIILIGYMGAGKTCVGDRLSQKLSYRFLDTDRLIEQKVGASVKHIFANYGEEYFRDKETGLLQELYSELDLSILSTGGGLPLREQNGKLLMDMGFVVYLKASVATTMRRLAGDKTRPLLQGEDVVKRIESMLTLRNPIYEGVAHKCIITDHKTIDEITAEILGYYQSVY